MRSLSCALRPGLLLAPFLVFAGLVSCSGDAGETDPEAASGGSATTNGKQRPVILISIDSLRADFTTPYGHVPRFAPEEQTTPFLSWMAEEGVLFEHASAASPWTLPSHMTLLTGMSPMEHGVRSRKYSLDKGIDLVSDVFQGAGYHTGGFFTAPFLHPAWGFGRGFDVYVPSADYLGTIEAGEVLSAAGKSPEVVELHEKSHTDARTGEQAIDRAITWLDHGNRYEEPFFVFLHLWDPHYDYFPPKEYAEQFLPNYTGSIVGDEFLKLDRELSEQDLFELQALYEAEIRYTDDQIARLYAQLEAWGIADDVILAVVSDHGDEFMEHGNRGHHLTLLEEVMHVPMVVHAPGLIEGGTRVQGSVSIRDLAPTLIDLAGLPAWTDRSGLSLQPMWQGADVDRQVSLDLLRPAKRMQLLGYRKGFAKGIQDAYKNTLRIYDLKEDPGELHPVLTAITEDIPFAKETLEFLTRESAARHRVDKVKEAAVITDLLDQLGYTDDVSADNPDDEEQSGTPED